MQTIDSQATREARGPSFWLTYIRHRYAILFYSLLLMLVAMPIATALGLPGQIITLLFGLCLLTAVMPNGTRRNRPLLFTLVLALIAAKLASEVDYLMSMSGSVLALFGFTGLVAAAGAMRHVMRSPAVDSETIYAALSTYMLAGVFFGLIYWSVERTWPGSLEGPSELTEASAVYFSFVTLATLGYGDFLPRTELTRGLATLEVIGGQMFLAVTIARLVSLFRSSR